MSLEKALVIDEDSLYFANRDWGQWLTWGEERGVPDVANSHYILNFGANPYETHESLHRLYWKIDGRSDFKRKPSW